MLVKLNTLINSSNILEQLFNTRGFKSITAYRISKNYSAIKKEFEEYEKIRIKTLEEYANKDDEGNAIIIDNAYDIKAEDLTIVNEEVAKLQNEEVNIDIKKVSLDDIESAGLAPIEIEAIEFMLDIEAE